MRFVGDGGTGIDAVLPAIIFFKGFRKGYFTMTDSFVYAHLSPENY